jgi:hypothetical protein
MQILLLVILEAKVQFQAPQHACLDYSYGLLVF